MIARHGFTLQCHAGNPLVMISGRDQTLSNWFPSLLEVLAAERQVTIFDNRGIGNSTDTKTDGYTIEDYANSMVDLIEASQLVKPDILGLSMGGFISLTLAVTFPDSVNKLVLADTSSGGLLGMLNLSIV